MDPDAVQEALSVRGSFLKKRILQEIYDNIPGLFVMDEEVGVRFGETQAADMVCFQTSDQGNAFYVLECHRAGDEAAWVFLKHIGLQFRELRKLHRCELLSDPTEAPPTCKRVCSEGYELREEKKGKVALEATAVVDAANLLSGAYLGFIKWLQQRKMKSKIVVVPILVTTARLRMADFNWSEVDIASGNLKQPLKMDEVDWVILKHSFPTPPQETQDFRLIDGELSYPQLTTESLYIVQSDSLKDFLSSDQLAYFRQAVDR
jgi:hypothetical protein